MMLRTIVVLGTLPGLLQLCRLPSTSATTTLRGTSSSAAQTAPDENEFPYPEDPKCFDTTEELRAAVKRYVDADTYDPHLAKLYGWPMGMWCVANIRDFSNLFCSNVDNAHHRQVSFDEDLRGWDVSQGTTMAGMFQNCHRFNNAGHALNGWDVSHVTSMSRMFASARQFNVDIGKWDVGAVKDMSYMFMHAFSFDQNLNAWELQSVRTTERMFRDARSYDPSHLTWDTSRIPNTSHMFSMVNGVSLTTSAQLIRAPKSRITNTGRTRNNGRGCREGDDDARDPVSCWELRELL